MMEEKASGSTRKYPPYSDALPNQNSKSTLMKGKRSGATLRPLVSSAFGHSPNKNSNSTLMKEKGSCTARKPLVSSVALGRYPNQNSNSPLLKVKGSSTTSKPRVSSVTFRRFPNQNFNPPLLKEKGGSESSKPRVSSVTFRRSPSPPMPPKLVGEDIWMEDPSEPSPWDGGPVDGWHVLSQRSADKWFIHPSRLPANWGPYYGSDGFLDLVTLQTDLYAFTGDLVPMIPPLQVTREAEAVARELPTQCAETALAYYNQIMCTSFEFVEALELNIFVFGGLWYHLNFWAKTCNCTDLRLFFAELRQDDPRRLEVTACTLLECNDYDGISCTFCQPMGKRIHHPAQGFHRGCLILETKHEMVGPQLNADGFFDFQSFYASRYGKLPPPAELSTKELDEIACLRALWCSQRALAYYNEKEGKDFQLVETLKSEWILLNGVWYHCNFNAKPRNANCAPKLFFAEIQQFNVEPTVTFCTILESNDFGAGDCKFCGTGDCRLCGPIAHPACGYVLQKDRRNGVRQRSISPERNWSSSCKHAREQNNEQQCIMGGNWDYALFPC